MEGMTDRRLWRVLQTGSRLYGTTVPGSDDDLLHLYIPTTVEMVENKRLTLPQRIENGVDSRDILLGDFVMSLGRDPERSILAYHYSDWFGDLQTYWLNGECLRRIFDVAENMWFKGTTPKNKAQAYRYALAGVRMSRGERLYPLTGTAYAEYMALRNDAPDQRTDNSFKFSLEGIRSYTEGLWKSVPHHDDRQKRAEWVMLRYLGLVR